MESKHPLQTAQVININAHLYVRFADVVWRLRPPCRPCRDTRLPHMATAKHQTKPPNSGPSTLLVEVAHNAMLTQTNTGAPSWPSTI